jgi:hypothetical protein
MFNATDLLKQWNKSSETKKELKIFWRLKGTQEFLEVLKEDLKGCNYTHLKTRGKYGGTFMRPFLFIKFAMWLNPRFELVVIDKIHYLCCK